MHFQWENLAPHPQVGKNLLLEDNKGYSFYVKSIGLHIEYINRYTAYLWYEHLEEEMQVRKYCLENISPKGVII